MVQDGGRKEFPITYTWMKNIRHAVVDNEGDGNEFYRARALLEDSGDYMCVATNGDHVAPSKVTHVKVVDRSKDPEEQVRHPSQTVNQSRSKNQSIDLSEWGNAYRFLRR